MSDDGDRRWFESNYVDQNLVSNVLFTFWAENSRYGFRTKRQSILDDQPTTVAASMGTQLSLVFRPTYVIRLAVFYDRRMAEMHKDKRELMSLIGGILQQVQLIYRYRSMHTRIRISVLSIQQVEGDRHPETGGGDVDKYLDSFCAWQRLHYSQTPVEQRWNHAILLTGEKLYRLREDGQKDFKVLGKIVKKTMNSIKLN